MKHRIALTIAAIVGLTLAAFAASQHGVALPDGDPPPTCPLTECGGN